MTNTDLNQVCAGMVLAADVAGADGNVLLQAGTTLNDRQLDLLRAHGVTVLQVTDTAPATGDEPDADELDRRLQERFGLADANHPLIRELLRLCRQRRHNPPGTAGGQR
ncbi:MAG TPA: hypothetical protein VKA14_00650 [Gammaproteobacteria bacterium]|nr:hypothetical protein [Gammaproteobacteria bacterium]